MKYWNKFWFDVRSRESLCLLRIFFGIVFLFKLTGFHNLQHIEKLTFRFTKHAFITEGMFYLEGFRNPVPGFDWLPVPSFQQYQAIEDILFVCTVFFIIGFFTRFFGVVIALAYTYLFLISQFSYHHHVMTFVVVLLILGFSSCNGHYSIDAVINKKIGIKRKILPIRLIQVFISIVYFFSFIQKCNYSWLSGDIILLFLSQGSIKGDFVDITKAFFNTDYLSHYELYFWRLLGPFTVLAEALLAFGLWVPVLRRFTILIGLLLHLGIDMTMGVGTFSMQMMVLYIAFITPESYGNTVLYNGKKIRHRAFVFTGRMVDWLQRIKWESHDDFSGMVFYGPDKKYRQGTDLIFRTVSLFPITFVPSFMLGIYIFIRNTVFRK